VSLTGSGAGAGAGTGAGAGAWTGAPPGENTCNAWVASSWMACIKPLAWVLRTNGKNSDKKNPTVTQIRYGSGIFFLFKQTAFSFV
jgi:hypothetical protein